MVCGDVITIDDTYDDRGACADEVGHVLVGERVAVSRFELAESIQVGPPAGTGLRVASTAFRPDDAATVVLSLLYQGRVWADLSGTQLIDRSNIGQTTVILETGEFRRRVETRALIAAAGPITRAVETGKAPEKPLDRVRGDGYRIWDRGVWFSDAIRTLMLAYFLAAPAGSMPKHPKSVQWDVIKAILDQIQGESELRNRICDHADQIFETVLDLVESHGQRSRCVDYFFAKAAESAATIPVSELLISCGVPSSTYR